MSENEKMRLVECDRYECDYVFEIPESCVKEISRVRCILHEKVECPKCGRKAKSVLDYALVEEGRIRDTKKATSPISCPCCNSRQLHTSDKGYSIAKGLAGSVVAGGIGLLAGFHGSKKVMITCLECSHKWEVGK